VKICQDAAGKIHYLEAAELAGLAPGIADMA
jgi:hypothetical protein